MRGVHFQDFRNTCSAERTDFQSVLSIIPDFCPEFVSGFFPEFLSGKISGIAVKGFRIGIPEQQLKPHALRARGTVADIAVCYCIYLVSSA